MQFPSPLPLLLLATLPEESEVGRTFSATSSFRFIIPVNNLGKSIFVSSWRELKGLQEPEKQVRLLKMNDDDQTEIHAALMKRGEF